MPSSQNATRKHHYVPVFYQTYFTNSNGLLWVYDRQLKTWKEVHPSRICAQTDLYAVETEKGTVDRRVETEVLSKIDGLSAGAFSRLVKGEWKSPSPELLGAIIFFAALQNTRVPANREFISRTFEGFVSDYMEVAFGTLEHAKASISNYERTTGKKFGVTPESLVETVKRKGVRIVATETPFIESVLKDTFMIAEVFQSLDVKLLVSPPQVGFILCDTPVTLVPPPKVQTAGFLSPGTFTFMPLTRRLCLRLGPQGSGFALQPIEREEVRFINQNTAINSERFVMGPERIQLDSVIRRSGASKPSTVPRWKQIKIPDNKGGIMRMIQFVPRGTHYLSL
jgi:hypothetical protein